MSTASRWTLIGMRAYDPSLFDTLELPEGYDKQTFVDALLLEHGEKCVLYTDPDFMKYSIGIWSRKWNLELTRIYEALTAEYNPLYNYDRFEEISDGETRSYSRHENGTRNATDKPDYTTSSSGSASNTNTSNESSSNSNTQTTDAERDRVTEHKISADNSSDYSPEWRETTNDGKTKQTNNGSTSNNRTDSGSAQTSDSTRVNGTTQNVAETDARTIGDNESRDNTHTAHIYGNIGVTTSTQMINEILKQRLDKNLYDVATRLFANELLIPIY